MNRLQNQTVGQNLRSGAMTSEAPQQLSTPYSSAVAGNTDDEKNELANLNYLYWKRLNGADQRTALSQMSAIQQRGNLRSGLQSAINDAPGQMEDELGLLRNQASDNLNKGIRSTRKNYSDRGLLYSGIRQGAEASKRNEAASTLASNEAGVRQDFANLTDKRKQAIASLGMDSQNRSLELADQALESSMRNRVARLQAMETLAGGLGAAAGTYYGSQKE